MICCVEVEGRKNRSWTKSGEDTRSTTDGDVPQNCKGARAPSGRRRRNRQPWLRIRTIALSMEFSRFGSRKLPRFHRCLQGWRQLTARTRRAMPAPVWEGIGTQLTLVNQLLMTAFILISLVTYMRPSELLQLRKNDLVPPLAPLLPCWSIVIAASETEVSTNTESAMGQSLWLSATFNRSTSSCPHSRRETRGNYVTLQQTYSRLRPTVWDSTA